MSSKSLPRWIVLAAVVVICGSAFAQTHPATSPEHNPYTMHGMLVRGHMQIPIPEPFGTIVADMGPVMFQEVEPCTLVSTLATDNYPAPWGGPSFIAYERRAIPVKGFLGTNTWVNPCSHVVPFEAMAVVTRVHAFNTKGDGGVFISPGTMGAFTGTASLNLRVTDGAMLTEEAGTMINDNGTVLVEVSKTQTDLQIEILGYFVKDPILGDRNKLIGPQGPQGEKGEAGAQGELGPAGPQGPKGDQGLQGDIGPVGPSGPQGAKGDQGAQGEIGPIGPSGPQGAKGDQGAQGDIGPVGPSGPQGAKGDQGAQGDIGPAGPTGPEGRAGAQGLPGPAGPSGPQGPSGPPGPPVSISTVGDVFPPGGQISCLTTVPEGSAVICSYTEENSPGNACSANVYKSGDQWCVYASGKPNAHFQVIIFMPTAP